MLLPRFPTCGNFYILSFENIILPPISEHLHGCVQLWHALSKTVAEKAAWALAMDRGVSMVCINAGLLTGGPDLTITNPYLKGAAEMYEDGVFVTVDLDFLVDAHISVFENIASFGRYLCFNHVIKTNDDAVKLLRCSPQIPHSLLQGTNQPSR